MERARVGVRVGDRKSVDTGPPGVALRHGHGSGEACNGWRGVGDDVDCQ